MKLKQHYITRATKSTSEALSMAMQLWEKNGKESAVVADSGISELVQVIHKASCMLRSKCTEVDYRIRTMRESGED